MPISKHIQTPCLKETTWSSSDYLDEASLRWPQVPQAHIDWSCQHGSAPPTTEAASNEWHYAFMCWRPEI